MSTTTKKPRNQTTKAQPTKTPDDPQDKLVQYSPSVMEGLLQLEYNSHTILWWYEKTMELIRSYVSTKDENGVRRYFTWAGVYPATSHWDRDIRLAAQRRLLELVQRPTFVLPQLIWALFGTSRVWSIESLARHVFLAAAQHAYGLIAEAFAMTVLVQVCDVDPQGVENFFSRIISAMDVQQKPVVPPVGQSGENKPLDQVLSDKVGAKLSSLGRTGPALAGMVAAAVESTITPPLSSDDIIAGLPSDEALEHLASEDLDV